MARPIRLLLVDDHAEVRDALRTALPPYGFEVVGTCDSGEAAEHAALRLRPDAVLMDLVLPGIDGIEATCRIRRADPEVRVVVLTAHANTAAARRVVSCGASAVLTKDVALGGIAAALRGEPAQD